MCIDTTVFCLHLVSFPSYFSLLSPASSAPSHLFAVSEVKSIGDVLRSEQRVRKMHNKEEVCLASLRLKGMLTCIVHMKSYSELKWVTVRGQRDLWH